jgi:hypothetical protein
MKTKLFVLIIVFLTTDQLLAQFTISAEFRPRGEYRNGYSKLSTPDKKPSIFISQRTRLNFRYVHKVFSMGISVQDTRIWGEALSVSATGIFGSVGTFDLTEGWIKINMNEYHAFNIGRQYLMYDDQRLLGNRNWNQYSLTYDALVYKFLKNDIQLDIGMTLNNDRQNLFNNYFLSQKIKTIDYIYVKKSINDLSLSVIGMATGFQKSDSIETIYLKGTYGLNAVYHHERFDAAGGGYYQNGKNKSGHAVSAYFYTVSVNFNVYDFKLGAGMDCFSGNDQSRTDSSYIKTEHLFDNLYGARHKYYGYMDYFNNIQTGTSGGGLRDIYFDLHYSWKSKFFARAILHLFYLQNQVSDPYHEGRDFRALNKHLGDEVDIVLTWKINDFLNLEGGYCMMFPAGSLEAIQDIAPGESSFSSWAYLMLTAKPVFWK